MLVALMGPLMNLLLAIVVSIVLVLLAHVVRLPAAIAEAGIRYFLVLNIMLTFFNLLPVPPLDGGSVLAGLLPQSLQVVPQVLQRYGTIVFFLLLLSGALKILMRPAYQVAGAWAEVVMRLMAG